MRKREKGEKNSPFSIELLDYWNKITSNKKKNNKLSLLSSKKEQLSKNITNNRKKKSKLSSLPLNPILKPPLFLIGRYP